MRITNNQQAFLTFVRTGLWQKDTRLLNNATIDFSEVYRLAAEQSVVGLVASGIGQFRVNNSMFKIPKSELSLFIGNTYHIEKRNLEKNEFLAWIIGWLREKNIYSVLVKGQGIAQCYEKPLWRVSGDIDLLMDEDNYRKAIMVLPTIAQDVQREYVSLKHQGMTINGIAVEVHGALHTRLSRRIDQEIDAVQADCFHNGDIRAWKCGETDVFLPAADNDVIFVFTHILHHLFIDGIGLKQICDLCRLLWTYRDSLDHKILESRILKMGIMSEWKAFATLAVDWLGMPVEAMPFYSPDKKWRNKSCRVLVNVFEFGNQRKHRNSSHSHNCVVEKLHSFWIRMINFGRNALAFPWDSVRFFCHFVCNGVSLALDHK